MIRAIVLFPVLILSLYGLGEWLRERFLGAEPFSPGRIGRAIGFGILAHGLLMTVLGFTWLLRPPIAAALTALPALLFCRIWYRDLVLLLKQIRRRPSPSLNTIEIVLLVLIVFLSLVRGFNALAPNISWDATSHHYLVPAEWLKSGRFFDLPSVVFSYYPSLTESGIAGTMALGSDFLSNLYGWLFGALAILALVGIGSRHFDGPPIEFQWSGGKSLAINRGRFIGIVSAFIFTMVPGVGVQTSGGYVDLPLACWTLLAADMVLEFAKRPVARTLIAAGLFAGALLSTKHTGIISLLGLFILLIWIVFAELGRKVGSAARRWALVLGFLGIAILLPLPWYIRSTWLTGNPFYPFGILGLATPPQPPFTPSSYIQPDYHRTVIGLLTYWLHLTFSPTVAHDLGRNYPLVLPLLFPLAVLFPTLAPRSKIITALSGFSILVVYALFPEQTRYHIAQLAAIALGLGILAAALAANPRPIFAASFLLLGEIIALWYLVIGPGKELLAGSDSAIRWRAEIVILLIALATIPLLTIRSGARKAAPLALFFLVLGIGTFIYDFRDDFSELGKRWKVVSNVEAEDAYMLRESPFNYGTIHYINHDMNWRNMRILCLEPRLYRLKADWVTWYGLEEPVVPTTPAENVAIWYRGGFTHILLGDDIALKALMFYNIVHQDGWDIPGATPEEMTGYLQVFPDDDTVTFRLQDLWTNFAGEPFTDRSRHFTRFWLPRELKLALFPAEEIDGETWYTASRLDILTNPTSLNQYAFVRDFREMVDTGGIKVVYTDELTFLFECDYPAYLRSHPNVDLETLGLVHDSN
jgi:hypothetical protein